MKRIACLLLILLPVLLTACGTASPDAAPSAPTPSMAAVTPTETPAPTPVPAETAVPTETAAPTETPAPTEKPDWASLGGTAYDGKAKGYGGYVHVTVVLNEAGEILDVQLGRHNESEGYGEKAISVIPELIIKRQSLDLDAVTGATLTSEAILAAVANALMEAGLDPQDYGFAP